MRVVRTHGELDEAVSGRAREAKAVVRRRHGHLELYIERPRHSKFSLASRMITARVLSVVERELLRPATAPEGPRGITVARNSS